MAGPDEAVVDKVAEKVDGEAEPYRPPEPYRHSKEVPEDHEDSHDEHDHDDSHDEHDHDDSHDDSHDDGDDDHDHDHDHDHHHQGRDNLDDRPPLADEPSAGMQGVELALSRSQSRTDGMSRTQTRASRAGSVPLARTPTVVPRAQRRGLFGQFALLPEIERPYDYARRTKWLITLIVALSASAAPMGSSIFYPALTELADDLHTQPTVANLTVAFYMLAMAIFPLWWSAFSETLGRRTIYLVSFSLFVLFSALSAVSHSIGMLIVMRVLGGGASASVQAVGAGTIADIWLPSERGRAMGIFYLGPLTGPLLAPIVGGALAQRWGWQSTMWFLTVYGGLVLLMLFFCLPETLARRDNNKPRDGATLDRTATGRSSVGVHTRRLAAFLRTAFVHPLSVLLYLRFPPILLTVVYGSVTFGALFVLNVSLQSAYQLPAYGFSEIIIGLLYIPTALGYFLASLLGGRWIDHIMAREARRAGRYDARGQLVYLPEDRMRENAWLAASLFPGAMIWFGWTIDHGVFWIVPAIACFIFGVGSMLVFGVVTTMLTEFLPRRSSGGIALNNLLRNIFSCVGVVVAHPLINAMGYGWLCTMVALLAFVNGNLCIFLLRRYGARWRTEMDAKLGG